MKKFFYTLFVAVFVATIFSCTKEEILLVKQLDDAPQTRFDPIYIGGNWQDNLINNDTTMVFGPQLANPYNVDVMRQALATIREDNPDFFFPTINTSHYYVRFRPESYEQMCDLFARDTSIIYLDFPLDREVVSGNSYHDPAIVDTLPTYQYASIRKTKWNNLINGFDIEYEILDELFIPDDAGLTIIGYTPRPGVGDITPINPGDSTIWDHPINPDNIADPNSSGTSVTWNAVNDLEDMAYQITGNSDEETDANGSIASPASTTAETMSSSSNGRWIPDGRIRVYDDIKGGMIPLEGVKVIVYRGCNVKKCYTNSNGNFTCGSFKKKASYKIKWERGYWDIRDGLTGQAYYNGLPKTTSRWYLDIGNDPNHKLLGYATIHRALHRMYYGDNGGIIPPTYSSRKIKVGYLDTHPENKEGSLGRFIGNNLWLGGAKPDIEIFRISYQKPDGSNVVTPTHVLPSDMFYATCHELGHATHFRNGENSYKNAPDYYCDSWARFVEYIVGEKEYEELGLLNVLYGSTTLNNTMWYQPNTYNIQNWTADPQSNQYNYTPFFIDVYDDYNQQDFYRLYGDESIELSSYPNDQISYTDIAKLQSLVFERLFFESVVNGFNQQNLLTSTELFKLQVLLSFYKQNNLNGYEEGTELY